MKQLDKELDVYSNIFSDMYMTKNLAVWTGDFNLEIIFPSNISFSTFVWTYRQNIEIFLISEMYVVVLWLTYFVDCAGVCIDLCHLPFFIGRLCRKLFQNESTSKWMVWIGHSIFISDVNIFNKNLCAYVYNIYINQYELEYWI